MMLSEMLRRSREIALMQESQVERLKGERDTAAKQARADGLRRAFRLVAESKTLEAAAGAIENEIILEAT